MDDHQLPYRTPWRHFPDVVILAPESAVKSHPDYPAALAATLTGKPYSARLSLANDTLQKLRSTHGSALEEWWKKVFGYDFDLLTESEARYLVRADSAQLIRDRIVAARQGGDA